MRYFALQLETMSPLSIRADHSPSGVENAPYISGTTLLGSLAALHRMAHTHPDDAVMFEQLFLSGHIRYPDLYPANFKHEDFQAADRFPVYPLPKTAQSCKRFPGFISDGEEDDDDPHGARDSLLDWAAFTLGSRVEAIDQKTLLKLWEEQNRKNCTCGKPMDHFSGYYRRVLDDNGVEQLAEAKAETRLQTRTGINRATGTVQESILYSRRVFEEHTRFWGLVQVEDGLVQTLEPFINDEIGLSGLARIGTGRSRGMGKVNLYLADLASEAQPSLDDFKQRVKDFDAALRKQVEAAFSLDLKPLYFAITLHSPVIACDELLRYRGVIDEVILGKLLDMPADTFELVYQNASTRQVMGWNDLWGTPRTKEIAIETGSVFLFSSTVEAPEAKEELLTRLFALEEQGVGRRRAEGFGRVRVCDPFHLEVTLK